MSKIHTLKLDSLSFQEMIDEDAEFIPLMTAEDEDEINKETIPNVIPILPLRNTVLFPGVVIPITASRDTSIQLIEEANKGNKTIGVVAQKNDTIENPTAKDIYNIGVVAKIIRVLKMPDGNTTVIIQGKKRFKIDTIVQKAPYLKATVQEVVEPNNEKESKTEEFKEIMRSVKDLALDIISENPNLPSEASFAIKNIHSDSFLVNFISSNMSLDIKEKQQILETSNLKERSMLVLKKLNKELQRLELQNDIQSKTRVDIDQQQRDFFLQQQLKTIQEELGGSYDEEVAELREKGKKKKWPKEVKEVFEKEIDRLSRMNSQMSEYSTQRNYLELMLDLPWETYSKDKFDLKRAIRILDRDHFGLDKVKERIIEHLAVLKLKGDMKSPIICLYGPPGVGKTSLGKSIAESLGRKYVRMSLGGMRDESEIRGHRKTYVGAMPGRILQNIKKAGTSNPVFVLDEIDKLTSSTFNGDPSSAMLEVLDPEQNTDFYDNYLELGYDLSKVLFVATANDLSEIPWALKDRMEIINVSGYTVEEKVEIGKKHLLPKQLKEHGVQKNQLKIGKPQVEKIITGYTRESGVRGLDKCIAKMVRYAAKSIAMEEDYDVTITNNTILKVLKSPKLERDKYENNEVAGVVTGLAWTSVGGDILFIESIISPGKSGLSITGNLGTVMKESATIALEYIKAHASDFGIDPKIIDNHKLHIHVPEGATPKDGPSAGIAMLTSLISILTQRKVKTHLAMTGEITLRGKVLPVGGIKEKILAAKRAHIREIILCEENKRDIDEIKPEYLKGLQFHYVNDMGQVIDIALLKQKVKNAKKLKPAPVSNTVSNNE